MSFFGSRRHVEESVPPAPEPVTPPTPLPVQQPIGFETVIGSNAHFEGNFTSSSNVRIDGTFTGSININGNVLVGETAKINADLYAKNISIAGAVRGNVHGKKVQLLRTGRVWGDINATALTTEEGAFIDGKISMVSADSPQRIDPNLLVDEPGFLDEPGFVEEDALVAAPVNEMETMDDLNPAGDDATYYDEEEIEEELDTPEDLQNLQDEETLADTNTSDNEQWDENSWNEDENAQY
jgi:cytoskeletal protein CcmA (bactofilin family)